MKNLVRGIRVIAIAALAMASGHAMAKGGYIEIEPEFDGTSTDLSNPWWPLPEFLVQVHLAEEDDECVISVLSVMPWVGDYAKTVNFWDEDTATWFPVAARTVMDREYIDDAGDCDGDLAEIGAWELLEITLDWYAQDVFDNIWYVGEHTIAMEEGWEEECEHLSEDPDPILGVTGCLDGSWEVGLDLWAEPPAADAEILAGIIMLRQPEKGQFYFQEYWEDNATDMGKVLNFKTVDTFLFGELENCLMTKEWVPLEPGNVEHKYYCYGKGLVLVEGNAGGKTIWTDLVFDSRYPGLP